MISCFFVQVHMWLMKQTTLFTSTWIRKQFCYLNPVEHGCHVGKDGYEKNDEPEIVMP